MQNKDSKTLNCTWGIKRTGNGRYIIIDTTTGDTVDDINGNGCGSYAAAYNYGYNKFHSKGQCEGMPNTDELITLL